jgi:hypothetical protein
LLLAATADDPIRDLDQALVGGWPAVSSERCGIGCRRKTLHRVETSLLRLINAIGPPRGDGAADQPTEFFTPPPEPPVIPLISLRFFNGTKFARVWAKACRRRFMVGLFKSGSFRVLASFGTAAMTLAAPAAFADTITGYIINNTSYSQTSNSAPTTPFGYFFDIGAFFSTAGDFTSGSATYPGPASPQALSLFLPTELQYQTPFYPSLSALHVDYPFGTYSITATGPAGTQTANIVYGADYFTSNVPYLTNYGSLAGLNPAANFTVDYLPFTPNPGTNAAYTFLTFYNASTGAVVFGNEFQPPTSTSTVIPAGTLAPDTTYDFELNFDDRIVGYDSTDMTYIEQEFDVRTDGSFTTGAAVVPEPAPLAVLGVALLGLAFGARRNSLRVAARRA